MFGMCLYFCSHEPSFHEELYYAPYFFLIFKKILKKLFKKFFKKIDTHMNLFQRSVHSALSGPWQNHIFLNYQDIYFPDLLVAVHMFVSLLLLSIILSIQSYVWRRYSHTIMIFRQEHILFTSDTIKWKWERRRERKRDCKKFSFLRKKSTKLVISHGMVSTLKKNFIESRAALLLASMILT